MDRLTDKLCGLIVKGARTINALLPVFIGLVAAYFIVVFIAAMLIN